MDTARALLREVVAAKAPRHTVATTAVALWRATLGETDVATDVGDRAALQKE